MNLDLRILVGISITLTSIFPLISYRKINQIKQKLLLIAGTPSGEGIGIMNSPRVTQGNFNTSGVVKPQMVGIEIDLSDK